jgi:hypothetical protein
VTQVAVLGGRGAPVSGGIPPSRFRRPAQEGRFNVFLFACCVGCLYTLLALSQVGRQLIHGPARAMSEGGRIAGIGSVVLEMNALRRSDNVPRLVVSAALCAIAQAHAQDMHDRSYLGHTDPSGLDPFERMSAAHYIYGYAAENIAMDESLAAANRDLYASPEHLANIVDGHYTRVGVGIVQEKDDDLLVEDFSD